MQPKAIEEFKENVALYQMGFLDGYSKGKIDKKTDSKRFQKIEQKCRKAFKQRFYGEKNE